VSQIQVGIMIQSYIIVVCADGLIKNYFFSNKPNRTLLTDG